MLFMVWIENWIELKLWITNNKAKKKNRTKQDVTVKIVKMKNNCKQPWQFQYWEILRISDIPRLIWVAVKNWRNHIAVLLRLGFL